MAREEKCKGELRNRMAMPVLYAISQQSARVKNRIRCCGEAIYEMPSTAHSYLGRGNSLRGRFQSWIRAPSDYTTDADMAGWFRGPHASG